MDTCQRQLIPAALKVSLGEMPARSPAGTQPQAELKQHWQHVLWVCDSSRPGMDHQVRGLSTELIPTKTLGRGD